MKNVFSSSILERIIRNIILRKIFEINGIEDAMQISQNI